MNHIIFSVAESGAVAVFTSLNGGHYHRTITFNSWADALAFVQLDPSARVTVEALGNDDDEPTGYKPEGAVLYTGVPGSGSLRK